MNILRSRRAVFGFLLVLSLAASALIAPISANATPGDSFYDPISISTCQELEDIGIDGETSSKFYDLSANIDCTGSETWNGGEGFYPIGLNDDFTGGLRGNGFTISNVTINLNDYGVGLFGVTDGANLQNLIIQNIYVNATSSSEYVGGLIGECTDTIITDSDVGGYVEGAYHVGGLVGDSDTCSISGSLSDAEVYTEDDNAGGLVGYAADGTTIINSRATGEVTGDGYVGGFVGELYGSTIDNSYSTGDVNSTSGSVGGFAGYTEGNSQISRSYSESDVTANSQEYVGGFIGEAYNSFITESFAIGDVTAGSYVGGFFGYSDSMFYDNTYSRGNVWGSIAAGGYGGSDSNTVVSRSYTTSRVTASQSLGGAFIGDTIGSTQGSCFYDNELNGEPDSNDSDATPKTTAEMKNIDTFTDLDTVGLEYPWDFSGQVNDDAADDDIWVIDDRNDGYPRFAWQQFDEEDTLDNDNISDDVEAAAPNGGDGNNDGIIDSEQSNVASFVNSVTGKYVTLAVDDVCTINNVAIDVESSHVVADVAYQYPAGLLNFTIECADPGFSATVSLIFHGLDNSSYVLRKYNPNSQSYATIAPLSLAASTFGTSNAIVARYALVDGGPLDLDGAANGTLVDPVGLGQVVIGAPRTGGGGTAG